MEKVNGLVVIVVCFVIAVLLTLGFVNDCNLTSRAELLSQRLDSVADRQDDILKPIEIHVRQEDILSALSDLKQHFDSQVFWLKLQIQEAVHGN